MIFFYILYMCVWCLRCHAMPLVAMEFSSFPFLNVQWTASIRIKSSVPIIDCRTIVVTIVMRFLLCLPSQMNSNQHAKRHLCAHTQHNHCYQHHINWIQFISINVVVHSSVFTNDVSHVRVLIQKWCFILMRFQFWNAVQQMKWNMQIYCRWTWNTYPKRLFIYF